MDEPTASLSHHEAVTLIGLIRKLREQGIGIVYITHRLDEIFEIADRVTILRDGATVDCLPIAEVTRDILVRKMVDRELSQLYGRHDCHATGEELMRVEGLTLRHPRPHQAKVADIDFTLHRGEVLGFFGLIGAGRTEIMEMVFGMRPSTGTHQHRRPAGRHPRAGRRDRARHRLRDRGPQGAGARARHDGARELQPHASGSLLAPLLRRPARGDLALPRRSSSRSGSRRPSTEQRVINLSGGNQQKIVIAKWVARSPKILIVDEPTRGIDIGAKAEVHALLARLAREGMGVIVISSDLPEVLAVSDRVSSSRMAASAACFDRADASQETIMEAATA